MISMRSRLARTQIATNVTAIKRSDVFIIEKKEKKILIMDILTLSMNL